MLLLIVGATYAITHLALELGKEKATPFGKKQCDVLPGNVLD
jgi:hypothetical protein